MNLNLFLIELLLKYTQILLLGMKTVKFLPLLLLALIPSYLLAVNADLNVANLRMTSADTGISNSDGIINYNTPVFAWDANANALGYQISKDNGTSWTDVGSATTYTFSSLADSVYHVVVRAYQNDSDDDGVDEPSGVDGNHDGTDDSEQHNVTTLTTGATQTTISTTSGSSLTGVSSSGGASIDATLSDDGSVIVLPYGTVSFTVTGLSNGAATIELFYPYDESITGYAKQFADGTWHDVGAVVTHSSPDYTKVTFSITDGSQFDLDGLANGEVKDPGGAYRAGANATVAVPLFGLPGALLLSLLFGLVGLRRIYK